MQVHICAVGRLRKGPEKVLLDDYLERFDRIGRSFGLGPHHIHEVENRQGSNMEAEADLIARVIPQDAFICALDERGKLISSLQFSANLTEWRDNGHSHLAFIIGGADGIAERLRAQAHYALSFGKMVWPHMLVRVMLAEQLYRATSILANAPYHRE